MPPSDDPARPDALPHLIPPAIRARIPITRIEDDVEVPADTAHAAVASPLGIHLITLAYDYPDHPHLYFAWTVSRQEPKGEWGDIDLWDLHTRGVGMTAVTDWEPTPIEKARGWAVCEMGGT